MLWDVYECEDVYEYEECEKEEGQVFKIVQVWLSEKCIIWGCIWTWFEMVSRCV